MTQAILIRPGGAAGLGRASKPLPAWPLVGMVAGFPAAWAIGAAPFALLAFGSVMASYLVLTRRGSIVPGILPFFAFLLWVLAASVTLQSGLQAVGFVQRFLDLLTAGLAMLYYVNASERVSATRMIGALTAFWAMIVVLGLLAIPFADVRLSTPVGAILPAGLTSNPLVNDLVFPRMAEVQQPWGAPEPFNRPAAPFPYTNSWGAAYAILTPVAGAHALLTRRRRTRVAILALLVVSAVPALETSNRGMLLALAITAGYVVVRLALRGRLVPATASAFAALLGLVALLSTGALESILGRQEYSDSTGTRSSVYIETFRAVLDSPFVGWATPQNDATIGIALGTQGQAWLLMFSYGFVGLGLFLLFLLGAVLRTASAPATAQLLLHGVLVMIVPIMWFYSLGSMQLVAVALIAAILLRAQSHREVIA